MDEEQRVKIAKELRIRFKAEGIGALNEKEAAFLLNELDGAHKGIEAAVDFERALRNVIDQHMKTGLSVSQALGVLSLIKTEVGMSFFMGLGVFNKSICEAVFNAEVSGA